MFTKIKTVEAWSVPGLSANHGVFGIAYVENNDSVYVSCIRTQELLVIDCKTNRYTHKIPLDVGGPGLSSVVYNPVNGMLYTSAPNQNKLCVVDAKKEKLAKVVDMPSGSRGVNVDPKRGNAFVMHYGSSWFGGEKTITVLDKDLRELKKIEVAQNPWESFVDAAEDRTYVSCKEMDFYKPGTLCIIDNKSLEVVEKIKVGRRPRGVAASHKLGKAYVACRFDSAVYVIDLDNYEVIKKIWLDCDPIGTVFDESEDVLYVINRQGKMRLGDRFEGTPATLSKIDCKSDSIIGTVELAKTSHYGVLAFRNRCLYCPCEDNNDVAVVDTKNFEKVTTIPMGRCLDGLYINPKTGFLYSTSHISDELSIFDGRKGEYIKAIPVHGWPWNIAVNENTNMIYVNTSDRGFVDVVDGKTGALVKTIDLGVGGHFEKGTPAQITSPIVEAHVFLASDIVCDSLRNKIYVTSPKDDRLIVIDGKTNKVVKMAYMGYQASSNRRGRHSMAVHRKRNEIYVFNNILNNLTILNGETLEIIDKIDVPIVEEGYGRGGRLVLNEKKDIAYLNDAIIDLKGRRVVGTLPENIGNQVASYNAKSNRIFVVGDDGNKLSIVDDVNYRLIDFVKFERPSRTVVVDVEAGRLYLTTSYSQVDIYSKK